MRYAICKVATRQPWDGKPVTATVSQAVNGTIDEHSETQQEPVETFVGKWFGFAPWHATFLTWADRVTEYSHGTECFTMPESVTA
jgi:hypothetical protein